MTEISKREQVIQGLMAKGKTREQAEAFLDILGSAFRRRGWAEGEPLSEDQLRERFAVAHPNLSERRDESQAGEDAR